MKEVIEQKSTHIDRLRGSYNDSWGKVKETQLDILNINIGKMKVAPRNPCMTMMNEMEEQQSQTV